MITGIRIPEARTSRRTSRPSRSGRPRSRIIRSNSVSLAVVVAEAPSIAVVVVMPLDRSPFSRNEASLPSSSTIRIRLTAVSPRPMSNRQHHLERGPGPEAGAEPDPATVRFRDRLDDREPESGAAAAGLAGAALEAAEDPLLF